MADAGMGRTPMSEMDERDALDLLVSRLTGELPATTGDGNSQALDPALAETVRRLHALHQIPLPAPAFGDRLWAELTHGDARFPMTTATDQPFASNGRFPVVRRPALQGPNEAEDAGWRSGRGITQFAAAALILLAIVAGLLVIRFLESGDEHRGSIPAPVASPSPSSEATLEASPPAGPVQFLWQSTGDPANPIEVASRPAIAPDGSIWVPDGKNGLFHIFAPDGTFLETWGSPGTGEGQFDFIADYYERHDGYGAIAFAPDGSFYVVDTGNQRIQKFGPDRGFLTAWGSAGTDDGQFLDPLDIALDDAGRVFVVDRDRGQKLTDPQVGAIQVFDADGRFLTAWGTRGLEPGQLLLPTGLAIDRDGTILVTERDNARVQRFTPEGEYLGGWGGFGTEEGKLFLVMDVAVDAERRAFVADTTTPRVQVFDHDGQFLATWGTYGEEPEQFTEVTGVAIDGAGNAYVTDESGRLQKFRILTLPEPEATPPP